MTHLSSEKSTILLLLSSKSSSFIIEILTEIRLLHIFHHVINSDHFFQILIPIPIHIPIAQHVFRTEERRSVHAARHARHCEAQAWLDAVKKLFLGTTRKV
jgi:hypothetical protein